MATLKASLLKQGVPEALIDQAIAVETEPAPAPVAEPTRENPFPFRTPSQAGIPIQRLAAEEPPAPPPPAPERESLAEAQSHSDDVTVLAGEATFVLASRASRLKARLADYALVFVVGVGGAVIIPLVARDPSLRLLVHAVIAIIFIGIVGLMGTQLYLLAACGQTIGKRWMGIRIARVDTGKNGGFTTNILKRGLGLFLVAGGVRLISKDLWGVFGLVNVLLIFREDRRCLHDMIAGSIVVKAGAPQRGS